MLKEKLIKLDLTAENCDSCDSSELLFVFVYRTWYSILLFSTLYVSISYSCGFLVLKTLSNLSSGSCLKLVIVSCSDGSIAFPLSLRQCL